MRFIYNMKAKWMTRKNQKNLNLKHGKLDVNELEAAETIWIKIAQQDLTNSPKFEQLTQQFGLYFHDDGIIRAKGRIQCADLQLSTKQPIVLPTYNWLSKLIVEECHSKVFHNGTQQTICLVRSKYFILRCRQLGKRLLRKCVICRLVEGLPYRN